jgi:hypothetical protein
MDPNRPVGPPPSLTGLLATSAELLHAVWSLQQRLAGPEFAHYQRIVASYPEVTIRWLVSEPVNNARVPPVALHLLLPVATSTVQPAARGPLVLRPPCHRQPLEPQFCAKLQRRFLEHPITEMRLDKVSGRPRDAAAMMHHKRLRPLAAAALTRRPARIRRPPRSRTSRRR